MSSVYINAMDRPGALSAIARVFSENNIKIHDARIVTLGERIEDMFFVSGEDGRAITDQTVLDKLQKNLVAVFQDPNAESNDN